MKSTFITSYFHTPGFVTQSPTSSRKEGQQEGKGKVLLDAQICYSIYQVHILSFSSPDAQ